MQDPSTFFVQKMRTEPNGINDQHHRPVFICFQMYMISTWNGFDFKNGAIQIVDLLKEQLFHVTVHWLGPQDHVTPLDYFLILGISKLPG